MDEQRSAPVADKSLQQAASGWPGGWYVYENGRVVGPFTAEAAFALEGDTEGGKPRLISRKGFSQWYALKDLSEIFKMTAHLGRQVAMHAVISEAQLSAAMPAAAGDGLRGGELSGGGLHGIKVKGRRMDSTATPQAGVVGTPPAPTDARLRRPHRTRPAGHGPGGALRQRDTSGYRIRRRRSVARSGQQALTTHGSKSPQERHRAKRQKARAEASRGPPSAARRQSRAAFGQDRAHAGVLPGARPA